MNDNNNVVAKPVRFEILYVDDWGRKHLTFVREVKEVNYYRQRYYNVTVSPIEN